MLRPDPLYFIKKRKRNKKTGSIPERLRVRTPRDKTLPKALNSQNKGVYGGVLSREDNKAIFKK